MALPVMSLAPVPEESVACWILASTVEPADITPTPSSAHTLLKLPIDTQGVLTVPAPWETGSMVVAIALRSANLRFGFMGNSLLSWVDQRAPSCTNGDSVLLPLAGEMGAASLGWPSMRKVVRKAIASASKYKCIEVAVWMPSALVMAW